MCPELQWRASTPIWPKPRGSFGSGAGAATSPKTTVARAGAVEHPPSTSASTGAWETAVALLATTPRALATGTDVTISAQQGEVLIRLTVTTVNGIATAEDIVSSMLTGRPLQ